MTPTLILAAIFSLSGMVVGFGLVHRGLQLAGRAEGVMECMVGIVMLNMPIFFWLGYLCKGMEWFG